MFVKASPVVLAAIAAGALIVAQHGDGKKPKPEHAGPAPVLLLGDRAVERHVDRTSPDRPEAFRFKAAGSGKAKSFAVFVGSRNRAHKLQFAVYGDSHGHPGARLTSGTLTGLVNGGWNRGRLRAHALHKGNTYWVALLGLSGALAYQDRTHGPCVSERGGRSAPKGLPSRWARGIRSHGCPASVIVDSTARAALPAEPKSPPAGTPTTAPPTAPPTPPAPQTNCANQPSVCGYPDTTNSGVPAGTVLANASTASLPSGVSWQGGFLKITASNATVSNLEVDGNIEVVANGVHIENVLVNDSDNDQSVHIDPGYGGLVIEHSTIHGASATQPSSQGVLSSGVVLNYDQIYNEVEGVEGSGITVENSYIVSNGVVAGGHNEAIDVDDGDSTPTLIEHNTLLNPLSQTASVIVGGSSGPVQNVTIDSNLMAGGGYVTYCCEATAWGVNTPSSNTAVTNNRYSRIYFRNGGSAGPLADLSTKYTKFTGNYWDDTLKPVTP